MCKVLVGFRQCGQRGFQINDKCLGPKQQLIGNVGQCDPKCRCASTFWVTLTYVPDKLLLRPEAFIIYLEATLPTLAEPYENFAHVFLEDVNNEVVPRWLRIEVISENGPTRRIVLIDRQPKWNNAPLLASLSSR